MAALCAWWAGIGHRLASGIVALGDTNSLVVDLASFSAGCRLLPRLISDPPGPSAPGIGSRCFARPGFRPRYCHSGRLPGNPANRHVDPGGNRYPPPGRDFVSADHSHSHVHTGSSYPDCYLTANGHCHSHLDAYANHISDACCLSNGWSGHFCAISHPSSNSGADSPPDESWTRSAHRNAHTHAYFAATCYEHSPSNAGSTDRNPSADGHTTADCHSKAVSSAPIPLMDHFINLR